MSRRSTLLAKFFTNSRGKVVVWQKPNIPLIGWALFVVITHILPTGRWQTLTGYVSFGFIFTWAWLELTRGASYFRRALGAIVLLASIHSRLS